MIRHADVVVTAEKIEENILDLPMTITAFDADMLEEFVLQDRIDLQTLVPGLQFGDEMDQEGHGTVIRGIGTRIAGQTHTDRAVATYIDGGVHDRRIRHAARRRLRPGAHRGGAGTPGHVERSQLDCRVGQPDLCQTDPRVGCANPDRGDGLLAAARQHRVRRSDQRFRELPPDRWRPHRRRHAGEPRPRRRLRQAGSSLLRAAVPRHHRQVRHEHPRVPRRGPGHVEVAGDAQQPEHDPSVRFARSARQPDRAARTGNCADTQ